MDKSISVDDLVYVAHWPHECKSTSPRCALGTIHTVSAIGQGARCGRCGELMLEPSAAFDGTNVGLPITWLKKIRPLTELEANEESITA